MTPFFRGRIAEWDNERGCGWIESDGQRIFLHWREFAERRKRPEAGDLIRFTAGSGPNGQLCAQNAVHLNDDGRFGIFAGAVLAALILLPSVAIARIAVGRPRGGILVATASRAQVIDPGYRCAFLAGYVVLINLITYFAYVSDKARARQKDWRISEATLHFLELIGGWPGAFVAQRRLRHKCVKVPYQVVFWLIVGLYQYFALDYFQGWALSTALGRFLTGER